MTQLRMKGSISLSTVEIRDLCVKGSIQLCDNMIHALEDGGGNKDDDKVGMGDVYFNAMNDFTTFSNCLSQITNLSQFWVTALSNDKDQVQELLSKVLKSLMAFQKKKKDTTNSRMEDDIEVDYNKKESKKSKTKKVYDYNSVLNCDGIRSSAKSLLLMIDNAKFQGSAHNMRVSSKTD